MSEDTEAWEWVGDEGLNEALTAPSPSVLTRNTATTFGGTVLNTLMERRRITTDRGTA